MPRKTVTFSLFLICHTFLLYGQRTGNWGICIDQFQLQNAETLRIQVKRIGFENINIYKRGKWFTMIVEGFSSFFTEG